MGGDVLDSPANNTSIINLKYLKDIFTPTYQLITEFASGGGTTSGCRVSKFGAVVVATIAIAPSSSTTIHIQLPYKPLAAGSFPMQVDNFTGSAYCDITSDGIFAIMVRSVGQYHRAAVIFIDANFVI